MKPSPSVTRSLAPSVAAAVPATAGPPVPGYAPLPPVTAGGVDGVQATSRLTKTASAPIRILSMQDSRCARLALLFALACEPSLDRDEDQVKDQRNADQTTDRDEQERHVKQPACDV